MIIVIEFLNYVIANQILQLTIANGSTNHCELGDRVDIDIAGKPRQAVCGVNTTCINFRLHMFVRLSIRS